MSEPLVSVLIPTYESAAYVDRAVNSTLSQTYRNLEVIVQDNASSDETWDLVSRHVGRDARIIASRNHENIGPLRNWRAGLTRCTGKYVKIVWSDDWMDPSCVADCVEQMEEHPRSSLLFTAVVVHHAKSDHVLYLHQNRRNWDADEFVRGCALGHIPVSPGAAMVRREAANFDLPENSAEFVYRTAERTGAGADLSFLLNAALHGNEILYIPKLLNHFAGRADSLSGLFTAEVRKAYDEVVDACVANLSASRFPLLERSIQRARSSARLRAVARTAFNRATLLFSRR